MKQLPKHQSPLRPQQPSPANQQAIPSSTATIAEQGGHDSPVQQPPAKGAFTVRELAAGTLAQIELPECSTRNNGLRRRPRLEAWSIIVALTLAACGGESKNNTKNPTSNTDSGSVSSNGANSTTRPGTSDGGSNGPASSTTGSQASSGSDASTSAGGAANSSSGTGGSAGGTGGSGGVAGGGGAPPTCESQDVVATGLCDAAFGVYFLGTGCSWLSGCSCEGTDCNNSYPDLASCEQAHRGCISDCTPQDATMVGSCAPVPSYVFNGIECIAMEGCNCVGDDCDTLYSFSAEETGQADCEAAHSVCETRLRSCEEITAVYNDYVSHAACEDDADCAVVLGQCGIGIGGCHHIVNHRWGQEGVTALGQEWSAAGCMGPVCDCAQPPQSAVCDEGTCVAAP
jgi:hypothetical protein